jgi:F0F1-type ATP synthase membrane subunit c/vacuolar-type H+-ATPase subunit K
MIAGTLPFVFSGPDTSMILLAAAMVVIGAAQNGLWIPVTVSAYMGLHKHEVPNASMSIRIFQTIGSAFGAAILATIIGDDVTRTAATTPQAMAGAFDMGFIGLIACCVIAFIPSFLLSTRKGSEQPDA